MAEIDGSVSAVVLAGFVEGSDATLDPAFFSSMAARLVARSWPLGPPEAAAQPDAGIGVRLPRPGVVSDAAEREALEAATSFVTELASATQASDAAIAVEYDGEVIGWIAHGQADEGVLTGLLGEWRRALDA